MAIHGKNTVFSIDDVGGSLREISQYCDDVDFPGVNADVTECSGFGQKSKSYVAGQLTGTITINGKWNATADLYLNGIVGEEGSFEYGPEGKTALDIKYSGECICTGYNTKSPLDGTATFTATFQITGDVTRGAYT